MNTNRCAGECGICDGSCNPVKPTLKELCSKDEDLRNEVLQLVNKYLTYLLDPLSDKRITGIEWFKQNL